MKTPAVGPSLIRFACWYPLWMIVSTDLNLYNDVQGLDIFPLLPNGEEFNEGLKIMGQLIPVLLVWNFLSLVWCFSQASLHLVYIGLIDWIFTATLLVAIIFQAKYLPHNYSGCDSADDWYDTSSNATNFFDAASALNNSDLGSTPSDVCSSYVYSWVMGLVLMIMYFLSGLLCIGHGCIFSGTASCLDLALWFPRLLKHLYRLSFRLTSRAAYGIRYLSKRNQRNRADEIIDLKVWKEMSIQTTWKPSLPLPISLSMKRKNPPKDILTNFDVLMLVVRNLHYVDVINLSLVSKGLRQALFPPIDRAARSAALQIYTCSETKSNCWMCDMQICSDCSVSHKIREPPVSRHLKNCQAHCSDCYRKVVCRTGAFSHSDTCNLARKYETDPIKLPWQFVYRIMCQTCASKSPGELRSRREAHDRVEIVRLSKKSLNCPKCKVSLPATGPRWWVCAYCKSECRDRIHPSWARQMEV